MMYSLKIQELVQYSAVPVYGVTENVFNLKLTSVGISVHRRQPGRTQTPSTVMLSFSGEYAGRARQIHLHSYNIYDRELRHRALQLGEPHPYPPLSTHTQTLRLFQFDERAQHAFGQPTKTVESLLLMKRLFTIEIYHWEQAPYPAWFLLYDEDMLVFSQALGFVKEELVRLCQQCVVVNDQEQLIHQYQQELDQYLSHLGWNPKRD